MPLFRLHQGSLEESLKTTVIVKNISELKNVIKECCSIYLDCYPDGTHNYQNFDINIFIPYELNIEQALDPRCGWYTHMVTADFIKKGIFMPIGFLREPLED